MKMDVSKFKRVSSDDKQTILKHPRGHQIVIAHNALTPDLKKQIKQIPDDEEGYAEGGEVSDDRSESAKKLGIKDSELQQMDQFDVPDVQRSPASVDGENHPILGMFPNFMFEGGVNPYADATPQAAAPVAAPEAPVQGPAPASLAPPAASPVNPMLAQSLQAQQGYMHGVNEQKAGLQQEAAAQGALGKAEYSAEAEQQKFLQQAHQDFQSNYQNLNQEYQSVMHDYENQHINANHYMENMSSGKKVATAIGLVLSGIGSGLAGQENMAEKFLQTQIQRDIESQKANLGKTENLLSANLKQFGNLHDATQMTMAMQNGIYASKLKQAAALSMDPLAKARALQAAGQLTAQSAVYMNSIAQSQTAQGILNNPGASPLMKIQALPKDLRDNALKEYSDYKAMEGSIKEIDRVFKDFSKVSTGDRVNPFGADKAGQAEAALVGIAKNYLGEAMQEADIKRLVKPFVPGMLSNTESTRDKGAEGLKKMLLSKAPGKTPILMEYGIVPQLSAAKPEHQRLINWANAHPNDPKAKKILQRIGE